MRRRNFLLWWRRKPAAGLTCQEVVELVTAYLEDALPAPERERFEAHIALCEGCTAYVEQMRLMLRALGRIEPESLSDEATRELTQAFRDWSSGARSG